MQLPMDLKVKNLAPGSRVNENTQGNKKIQYLNKTNDGKYILRKTMAKYTTQNIVEREKQGFSSPDASWFRGESIDYVKRLLLKPSAPMYDLLDYKSVCELLESHFSGQANRRLLIWSLLYINELQS